MIGIICSLILAAAITFGPFGTPHLEYLNIILITAGSLGLLITALINILALAPLLKSELKSAPHTLELFGKDRYFRFINVGLFLFSLITYAIAVTIPNLDLIYQSKAFVLWLILFGIFVDLLRHYFKRLIQILNPFGLIKLFTNEAKDAVTEDRDLDLCQWVDGLTSVSLNALNHTNTSLCIEAIEEMKTIVSHFLNCQKTIGHNLTAEQMKELGSADEIRYTLFYVFQRMEVVHDKALEGKWETVCSQIVTAYGKMALIGAKFDMTLVTFPLHYLGKCTQKDREAGFSEIPIKTTYTLLEVSKEILTDLDIQYTDLKTPFFAIISQLEKIAKATFSKDKTTNLRHLTQPFFDLKELFKSEKCLNHPDTPAINQDIDRVLGEFGALELILKTIPPIPEVKDEIEMQGK